MFLQALELLQNSGSDVDSIATDLAVYKLIQLLTVHLPILSATFLLSQEYLGEKIICFPPENVSDSHGDAINEWCWNHGMWISDATAPKQDLYTQPHRYYPLYLPLQAVIFLTPIIIWNILTKAKLLATIRGTQEFLDDLLETVMSGDGEKVKRKAVMHIKQFHNSCIHAAENSSLAVLACLRLLYEFVLLLGGTYLHFKLYNTDSKHYHCEIPALSSGDITCTVPILDLLDMVWSVNVAGLIMCLGINIYLLHRMYVMHYSDYQPYFYNNLPYGDEDEFNEKVSWDNIWTKHSYMILIQIFLENNVIMTKAYILLAMQPDEKKRRWKERLRAKKLNVKKRYLRKFGDGDGDARGVSLQGHSANPLPDDPQRSMSHQGNSFSELLVQGQGQAGCHEEAFIPEGKSNATSLPGDIGMVSGLAEETSSFSDVATVSHSPEKAAGDEQRGKGRVVRLREMLGEAGSKSSTLLNSSARVTDKSFTNLKKECVKMSKQISSKPKKPKPTSGYNKVWLKAKTSQVQPGDDGKPKKIDSGLKSVGELVQLPSHDVQPHHKDYAMLSGIFLLLYIYCTVCHMSNLPGSVAIVWLVCQYKAIVSKHVDIDMMLTSLCKEMISSHEYLTRLLQGSGGDEKAFGKHIKVLGFQMKVLLMLVREYDDCLGESPQHIHSLLLHIKRNVPPSLKSSNIPMPFLDEIQKQVILASEPLLSYLLPNRRFMLSAACKNQELEDDLYLPQCLLLLSVMDLIHNCPDDIQEQWIAPVVHPEHEPRHSLLSALFATVSRCTKELCVPVLLPGIMCGGKAQRQVSLYEYTCTRLCAFVAAFPARHFTLLETTLLEVLLGGSVCCALLAGDTWCFMARYGTADLCRDHCFVLASLLIKMTLTSTIQCCHLVVLLRRLLRFMAPEHQVDFVESYCMGESLSVCSVLPLDILTPALAEQVTERLVHICTEAIHSWTNTSSITPEETVRVIEALHCLENLYRCGNVAESHISELSQMLIKERCWHLWEKFDANSAYLNQYLLTQQLVAALLNTSAWLIDHLDNKQIHLILSLINKLLYSGSGDTIKVCVLNLLGRLGKKCLPPSFEQVNILQEISELFAALLNVENPIIHGHVLHVFSQFAEETVHESVIPDTLRKDVKLQEQIVHYLNQVANGSIPRFKLSDVEKQGRDLERLESAGVNELFPTATWPAQQELSSTQESNYREALGHLQQGIQQLQRLNIDAPIPVWLLSDMKVVYSQLGSML